MPSEESTANADRHLGCVVDALKRELEAKSRELAEAREQQAATAGVLAAISSSPADLHRVFAEIAVSAARLCDAYDATIFQVDGDLLRLVAHHGSIPQDNTLPLTREVVTGRVVLERRTIQVGDLQAESDEYPDGSERARWRGHRTILAVPLMRVDKAIGVIGIRRTEVRQFTDRQIDLLKTFADQAVIAIENTRLFEAEQARTREVEVKSTELARSLEYQTAISDVLGVISRSPNELQPVFNTIVASSKRLLRAHSAGVTRVVGNELRLAAFTAINPETDRVLQNVYPMRLDGSGSIVAAIHKRTHFMIEDMEADDGYPRAAVEVARLRGYRSILFVPMLSKGEAIGTVNVTRPEPGSFSDEEIGLLKTFADQAVIAIENTRLFEAEQVRTKQLQARSAELAQSLEYQTAISDVLGVISRSPNELQPVLDTIVAAARTLCLAERAIVWRPEGEVFRAVAYSGFSRIEEDTKSTAR